ncbi:YDG domain-containing protein [Novosphingobium sp. ZN18A2]|uniref:beta strand repeat-containing protein n=1 Tax=Novosphingobium sp. ZN18A2 TaxID=3079861 RepID=UPI0030D3002A
MNHRHQPTRNRFSDAVIRATEVSRNRGYINARRFRLNRIRLAPLGALVLGVIPSVAHAAPATGTIQSVAVSPNSTSVGIQGAVSPPVMPLPTGANVVSGQATVNQTGGTLTVDQASQNAIINWQSFNIGSDNTVIFNQPNITSVALNRVLGSDPSAIFGHLNANGQVFLVNPNGVYFAPGAQIDVGGIVASTLDITDQDFLSGKYHFAGHSTAGVRNDGSIRAANGGYVAFIGKSVSNNGSIATPEGTTALGAGGSVDLTLANNSLLTFKVSSSALNTLAQNGGVIAANGGTVILSAQAKDALLQTVVNNTGQIQAQTVASHNGTIELLGGDSGTVQVAGTLDATAPNGGNGGFIETSGAHLKVADGTTITTKAVRGDNGRWLIDPADFTIAPTGGDITGAALSAALASTSVTIQTSITTTTGSFVNCTGINCGTGNNAGYNDIIVNDTVSWSANTLTLNAYRNIVINTAMNASGTAKLALLYGQGSINGVIGGVTSDYIVNAPINLEAGPNLSTRLGTGGSAVTWTVITSLGLAGDASTTPGTMTLQGVTASSLTGNYALGANIDASPTANWNPDGFGGYYGFDPIGDGNGGATFTGRFDGLGHTVSNLTTVARYAFAASLFGYTSNSAIRNIGMLNANVTGIRYAGGLVGYAIGGSIDNVYASGTVKTTSTNDTVGGLVGVNSGTISNAYATGSVSGSTNVGGLAGRNSGTINNAYATGNVSGVSEVGGLVGFNLGSGSKITNAYAIGDVTGTGIRIGGLVGFSTNGAISNAYATGNVSGGSTVGGLLGLAYNGTVNNVYATGAVSGSSTVGGLAGSNSGSTITNGYWDITTTGKGTNAGYGALSGTVTGGGGLTTAQLTAALPSGFTSSNWANAGNQTTPYLLTNTSFQTVSGAVLLGTDTSASPTQYRVITNVTQLQNINSTGVNLDYVLGNSIGASATAGWNGGAGFTPIGTASTSFTGSLEGLGYTIRSLYIHQSGSGNDGFGLFGTIGSAGAVSNLGLVGGSITGKSYTGALVGNNAGTISNVYSTASINGQVGTNVGGLAGYNAGTISNAYTSSIISNGGTNTGGLVGYNAGTISNAYTTGNVTGLSSRTGGLVGLNTGTIGNAYATGNVQGDTNAGGLVGGNIGTISNAYATGDVTANYDAAGGLIGINSSGSVINVYATGKVSLNSSYSGTKLGGVLGVSYGGSYSSVYWDTTTSGTTNSGGAGNGLTTAQLASALPSGFSSSLWANAGGQTTPYLLGNTDFESYSGSVILGTDTSATPTLYKVITRLTQLQNINSTGVNLDYVLGNNIDASPTGSWNGGAGFEPIGSNGNAFSGVFDGLSFAVSDLTINRPSTNFVGLFGRVGSGGVVRNIGIIGGSITGKGYVGGLVGSNIGGSVSNAYATGPVSGTSPVGGLVGYSSGSISNAYASGSVSGTDGLGGLVGVNVGVITDTYATGSVRVSGSALAYGIGGLVGANSTNGQIINAYASGSVTGNGSLGGLVGANFNGSVTNGYWDTTTGLTSGFGNSNGTVTGGGGLTTAQLAATLPTGFASSDWANADNQTTPYLLANTSFNTISGSVFLGTDTSATPTQYKVITSVTQLQNINSTGLGLDYVLGNSIDASATAGWNNGAGFVPFGNNYFTNAFTGVFDGLGFTVSNLTVNRPSASYVGLFGVVGSGGVVRNIGVIGGSFTGSYSVGALVGANLGTISDAYATSGVTGNALVGGLVGLNTNGAIINAYATGNVTGSGANQEDLGGLVGYNSNGSISNAYATGNVTGKWQIGGLVGLSSNSSTISDVYALGNVSGTNEVGGLVGSNTADSTITNAYATGSVSGTNKVGALVGMNSNGAVITNGYWDTSTGLGTGIGSSNGGAVTGGGGLTSTQMMQQASFTGFDFSSPVWVNYSGHTAPLLNVFLIPLTITADNQGQTYNGGTFGLLNPSYSVAGADTSGHLFGLGDAYNGAVNVGSYSPDLWSDQQGYRIAYVGGALSITAKTLSLTGLAANNKVYDGTTDATVSGFGSLAGIVGSDNVGLDTTATSASFADANAGTGKTVTVTGLALTGTAAGNYTLSSAGTTTADITAKTLSLTGLTANNKVYDGTTDATVSGFGSLAGIVGSDNVGLDTTATSASFADANAGTGKTVTVTGLALTGTAAGNYTLSSAGTTTADITAKTLSLTGLTANNKVYDGTTDATVSGFGSLAGIVGSDNVGLDTTATSASFADANAGTGKTVTVTGLALTGTAAGNYTLSSAGATTADITAKTLSLTGLTANNKVYDGTTDATVSGFGSLAGIVGSDNVGLDTTATSASFADANAGTGKTVTVTGLALTGTAAGNYTLSSAGTTTADITAKTLSVSLLGNPTKTYDGTTDATLSTSNFLLTGFVDGQGASVTQTDGSYASSQIGVGLAVTANLTIGDYSADAGTLLSNYVLPVTASGTGSILPSPNGTAGNASANAGQNATWGYIGQDGWRLKLDPRLQWLLASSLKSSAVQLSINAGTMDTPPCSIDAFTALSSACRKY